MQSIWHPASAIALCDEAARFDAVMQVTISWASSVNSFVPLYRRDAIVWGIYHLFIRIHCQIFPSAAFLVVDEDLLVFVHHCKKMHLIIAIIDRYKWQNLILVRFMIMSKAVYSDGSGFYQNSATLGFSFHFYYISAPCAYIVFNDVM